MQLNQISVIGGSEFLPVRTIEAQKFRLVIGSQEPDWLLQRLSRKFELVRAAGAGYKLHLVYSGIVDGWLCSTDTTFKWDVCAGKKNKTNYIY